MRLCNLDGTGQVPWLGKQQRTRQCLCPSAVYFLVQGDVKAGGSLREKNKVTRWDTGDGAGATFTRRMSECLSEKMTLKQRPRGCSGVRETCGYLQEECSVGGNTMCKASEQERTWHV